MNEYANEVIGTPFSLKCMEILKKNMLDEKTVYGKDVSKRRKINDEETRWYFNY